MALKNMLEKTELRKILESIVPTKYQYMSNLHFSVRLFSKDYPLLAPNELTNKKDSSIIGIAFDYMARFIIANHIEKDKMKALKNLVCINAFGILKNILSHEQFEFYKMQFFKAGSIIRDYIINKTDNYNDIIPYVFILAKLEQIQRTYPLIEPKSILQDWNNARRTELEQDLKKNCEVFEDIFIKSQLVKKDSVVVFNPHFGMWSIKCGGADADIFIDGVLYDFKCTLSYNYKFLDSAQICGYYLLHNLCKSDKDYEDNEELVPLRNMDIKAIALYKSRFGVIEKYNINFDKEIFENVMETARKYINEYYENSINYEKLNEEFLQFQKNKNNMS